MCFLFFVFLFIPTCMIFDCCVCMSRLKPAPNILPNKYNDYSVKWIHLKVCNKKFNISWLYIRMIIYLFRSCRFKEDNGYIKIVFIFILLFLEELQAERDRCKTLQNEMERCFSDLQLL